MKGLRVAKVVKEMKGYLRCKMITSQSVLSEAQVKNFFVSYKSYVLFSRYSSFCGFSNPTIYQICDGMMSISIWDRVHFWIDLLNHNSLTHQTWSIDWCKQGQYFSETFWTICRTVERQLFTKYLRLSKVFTWNRALREKYNFCFSRVFW